MLEGGFIMRQIIAGKRLEQSLKVVIDTCTSQFLTQPNSQQSESPQVSYFVGVIEDTQDIIKVAGAKENIVHIGASMIKVLIMECLFQQARLEKLQLQDELVLTAMPRVEGGGALQELFSHHKFSLLELCRLMMTLSDNWATNLLINHLGMDTINERAKELGLDDLKLERLMMDSKARQGGADNRISALAMAKLYTHLYALREESLLGMEMWNILGRQQFRDKIPFFWGEETPFYHKTGSLENIEHDGGVYMTLMGSYVIIILISNLDNSLAIPLEAEMGKLIREYLDNSLPPLEDTIIQDI